MSKKVPALRQRRSAAPRKTRAIMRGFSYYNTAGGGTRTHKEAVIYAPVLAFGCILVA